MKKILSFVLVFVSLLSISVVSFAEPSQRLYNVIFDENKTYQVEDVVNFDDWKLLEGEPMHNAGTFVIKLQNPENEDEIRSFSFVINRKECPPPKMVVIDPVYDPAKHYTLFTMYETYDWNGTLYWGDISPQDYKDAGENNIYVIASENYYFKDKPRRYTEVFRILPATAFITVEDVVWNEGEAKPELRFTTEGFLGEEGIESVEFDLSAVDFTKSGVYEVTAKNPVMSEGKLENYSIVYAPGNYTVKLKDKAPEESTDTAEQSDAEDVETTLETSETNSEYTSWFIRFWKWLFGNN